MGMRALSRGDFRLTTRLVSRVGWPLWHSRRDKTATLRLCSKTTASTPCLDAQKRLHGGSSKRRARSRFDARAPVAQLDRAPDYESGGQEFESLRARQTFQRLNRYSGGSCFPEIVIGKHMGDIRRIFTREECSGRRWRSYFGVLSLAVRWASAIWCEDHRQMSNGAGAQYRAIIGLVAKNNPSVYFLWVLAALGALKRRGRLAPPPSLS
jgi:hypothetical protein